MAQAQTQRHRSMYVSTVQYQGVKHKQGPGGGKLESRDEKVRYRNSLGRARLGLGPGKKSGRQLLGRDLRQSDWWMACYVPTAPRSRGGRTRLGRLPMPIVLGSKGR